MVVVEHEQNSYYKKKQDPSRRGSMRMPISFIVLVCVYIQVYAHTQTHMYSYPCLCSMHVRVWNSACVLIAEWTGLAASSPAEVGTKTEARSTYTHLFLSIL